MADPFASTTAEALALLGVSADYTPSGGSAIATTVIVDEDLGTYAEYEQLQEADQVVTVLRADAGNVNGVGEPAPGDTIAITDPDSPFNGTTFAVREERERDAYVSHLVVR